MPAGLLGIEELDRAEIDKLLARAKDFQPMQSQSRKKMCIRDRCNLGHLVYIYSDKQILKVVS